MSSLAVEFWDITNYRHSPSENRKVELWQYRWHSVKLWYALLISCLRTNREKFPLEAISLPKRDNLSQHRRNPSFVNFDRSCRIRMFVMNRLLHYWKHHAFRRWVQQAYTLSTEKVLLSYFDPPLYRLNSVENRHCYHSPYQSSGWKEGTRMICRKLNLAIPATPMVVCQKDEPNLHYSRLRRTCCQILKW